MTKNQNLSLTSIQTDKVTLNFKFIAANISSNLLPIIKSNTSEKHNVSEANPKLITIYNHILRKNGKGKIVAH